MFENNHYYFFIITRTFLLFLSSIVFSFYPHISVSITRYSICIPLTDQFFVLFSGLVQFTKAVRLYETQDPEVASLNHELRAVLMPPVGVSPPAAMGQNGAS